MSLKIMRLTADSMIKKNKSDFKLVLPEISKKKTAKTVFSPKKELIRTFANFQRH